MALISKLLQQQKVPSLLQVDVLSVLSYQLKSMPRSKDVTRGELAKAVACKDENVWALTCLTKASGTVVYTDVAWEGRVFRVFFHTSTGSIIPVTNLVPREIRVLPKPWQPPALVVRNDMLIDANGRQLDGFYGYQSDTPDYNNDSDPYNNMPENPYGVMIPANR